MASSVIDDFIDANKAQNFNITLGFTANQKGQNSTNSVILVNLKPNTLIF